MAMAKREWKMENGESIAANGEREEAIVPASFPRKRESILFSDLNGNAPLSAGASQHMRGPASRVDTAARLPG